MTLRTATVTLTLMVLAPILAGAQPQQVEERDGGVRLIESFQDEAVGTLPQRWYNQKADKPVKEFSDDLRQTYHYEVLQEGGNKFLRFNGSHGKHLNFPTKEVRNIDLYDTPVLSWKWRIHDYPEGANEDDKNDVAASIYVVFDLGRVLFKRVPKSIRYTWSSSLEKGTELSKFFGNQKIVVMGTGGDKAGQWQTFERNLVEDYRRLYGDDPPETPLAILILSDGNDTGETVKADYDDIMLRPAANN